MYAGMPLALHGGAATSTKPSSGVARCGSNSCNQLPARSASLPAPPAFAARPCGHVERTTCPASGEEKRTIEAAPARLRHLEEVVGHQKPLRGRPRPFVTRWRSRTDAKALNGCPRPLRDPPTNKASTGLIVIFAGAARAAPESASKIPCVGLQGMRRMKQIVVQPGE